MRLVLLGSTGSRWIRLEADGLVVDGTRANVLNNQVVVISLKDSGTKVTGLRI